LIRYNKLTLSNLRTNLQFGVSWFIITFAIFNNLKHLHFTIMNAINIRFLSLVILYCLLIVKSGNSQPGAIDQTFITNISNPFYVGTIAVQPDGKILIGGGSITGKIIRLNSDGSVDPAFSEGTGIGINNFVHSIAIQTDGKILVGGSFSTFNGVSNSCIVRLNVDGTLDPSFDTGIGTDYTIHSIAIQGDGKIIIGGGFISYNGVSSNEIARLNVDGSLDTSFNIGTGAEGNATEIWSLAIQPDGKIIIGGSFFTYNSVSRNGIARINADGSLDNSFNIGTGLNVAARGLAIQSDGKILVGGGSTVFNNVSCNSVIRLNSNGSLDNTFNTNVTVWPDFVTVGIAVQADGKIIVGGLASNSSSPRISRLNNDGTRDLSFNSCGSGANDFIESIVILPTNKILIGGYYTAYNNQSKLHITRILNNTAPCTLEASIKAKANGAEPSTSMEFEVSLNDVNATGADVVITYSYTGGTATVGVDYDNSVTSVVIPNGQSKAIITLPILDDNEFETSEDAELTLLSATSGITISPGASKAKASIIDDEVALVSMIGVNNAMESDPSMLFFISLSSVNKTGTDINVNYLFSTTGPGPYATGSTIAGNGVDYNNSITLAIIPNGQSTAVINVPIFNDLLIEGTEVIEITLISAATANGINIPIDQSKIAAGDLIDDDFYTVAISSAENGQEDGKNLKYVIRTTPIPSTPISVNFDYTGGTATAINDFDNSQKSIIIPANQTSVTVEIPIVDDTLVEQTETVELTLQSATPNCKIATDGSQIKTANIFDNDPDLTKTTITADKSEMQADGKETSLITVKLFDASGNNLSSRGNAIIKLFTTLGELSSVINRGNGTYTAILTAAIVPGNAVVNGTLNGILINDEAIVRLILNESDLIINEGVSPNGDGENDSWFIKGIEKYPNNSVKIFNRWGTAVWSTAGYNNLNNNWHGDLKSSLATIGTDLPSGTYFFLLDLGDGKGTKSGFILLNR
jgi:gliding motility-associated-like protein/uncharacterized delta-60 repeat protein